jgi:hypothetical protein
MKRHLLILIIVHISLLFTNGQGTWSISISYSPRIEHRDPGIKNLLYYPISPCISTDFRMADRLSLSIGAYFHFEKDKVEAFGIPDKYYISKTFLYEVPLQFNYHLNDKTKKFAPYIKTAIRYTFYHLSIAMHDNESITTNNYNDSYILWDFGAGFNLRIKENIFLQSQISYGIGLKHAYEEFKYFEPLIGLRYTFN